MSDFGEIVKQFNKFRRSAITNEQKGKGDYGWIQYETPLWVYQQEFGRLLPSITGFLSQRRTSKRTFAIDFMAAGQAMRDLAEANAIDGGLSITLNDFRKPDVIASDSKLHVDVLGGNILFGTQI